MSEMPNVGSKDFRELIANGDIDEFQMSKEEADFCRHHFNRVVPEFGFSVVDWVHVKDDYGVVRLPIQVAERIRESIFKAESGTLRSDILRIFRSKGYDHHWRVPSLCRDSITVEETMSYYELVMEQLQAVPVGVSSDRDVPEPLKSEFVEFNKMNDGQQSEYRLQRVKDVLSELSKFAGGRMLSELSIRLPSEDS